MSKKGAMLATWETGQPLAAALAQLHNAPEHVRAQQRLLNELKALQGERASPSADRPHSMVMTQSWAEAWEREMRQWQRLRDQLQAELAAGRFIGLGFQTVSARAVPGRAARLVAVPAAFWRAKVEFDWARSEVKRANVHVEDIRVLSREAALPCLDFAWWHADRGGQ